MGVISGMTGFASVKKSSNIADIEIEAISRNSKFLDVRVSGNLPFLEAEKIILEAVSLAGIHRGSIKILVKTKMKAVSYDVSVNESLLKKIKKELKSAGIKISSDQSFRDVISIPDLVSFSPRKTKQLVDLFKATATELIQQLKKQREKEGKQMATVLKGLVKEGKSIQKKIAEILRLLKKKGRLVVAQESSSDGEKDIFEEVKRLDMVLGMMASSLKNSDQCQGKNLDFICQEALRESNTILAKIKDPQITRLSLSLKTNVDRMREIVQNIE